MAHPLFDFRLCKGLFVCPSVRLAQGVLTSLSARIPLPRRVPQGYVGRVYFHLCRAHRVLTGEKETESSPTNGDADLHIRSTRRPLQVRRTGRLWCLGLRHGMAPPSVEPSAAEFSRISPMAFVYRLGCCTAHLSVHFGGRGFTHARGWRIFQ